MGLFEFLFPKKHTELNKHREEIHKDIVELRSEINSLDFLCENIDKLNKERALHLAMIYSTGYRLKLYMDAVNMRINNREERIAVREGLMADFPELTAGDVKEIFDKIYEPVEFE